MGPKLHNSYHVKQVDVLTSKKNQELYNVIVIVINDVMGTKTHH